MALKVRYNATNVYLVNNLKLVPGLNILTGTDEELQAFVDHPHVKLKQKQKVEGTPVIEILSEIDDPETGTDDDGIEYVKDKRKAGEIIEDIKEITDHAVLKNLIKDERTTVRDAAQARLDDLIKQSTPE